MYTEDQIVAAEENYAAINKVLGLCEGEHPGSIKTNLSPERVRVAQLALIGSGHAVKDQKINGDFDFQTQNSLECLYTVAFGQ